MLRSVVDRVLWALVVAWVLLLALFTSLYAQTPTPTPDPRFTDGFGDALSLMCVPGVGGCALSSWDGGELTPERGFVYWCGSSFRYSYLYAPHCIKVPIGGPSQSITWDFRGRSGYEHTYAAGVRVLPPPDVESMSMDCEYVNLFDQAGERSYFYSLELQEDSGAGPWLSRVAGPPYVITGGVCSQDDPVGESNCASAVMTMTWEYDRDYQQPATVQPFLNMLGSVVQAESTVGDIYVRMACTLGLDWPATGGGVGMFREASADLPAVNFLALDGPWMVVLDRFGLKTMFLFVMTGALVIGTTWTVLRFKWH